MENVTITLRYKKQDKIISIIPKNFSELQSLFFSFFDEKNNCIYEYSYKNELKKKIIIKKDDDLFQKDLDEIKANNYKIYIKEEDDESENEDIDLQTIDSGIAFSVKDSTIILKEENEKPIIKEEMNDKEKIEKLEKELNELKAQNIDLNMKIKHLEEDNAKKDNIIEDNENIISDLKTRIEQLESNKKVYPDFQKNELNNIENFRKEIDEISEKYKKQIQQCFENFQQNINNF